MSNVVILTGSARPNSASTNVAKLVEAELKKRGDVTPEIVEVADLKLPFFNAPMPPSGEGYEITDKNVQAWSDKITYADAVVWVMPEYNHSISGIQKNAIDWLFKEWNDKPLAIVAYGWYAGANVLEAVKLPLKIVKPDVRGQVGLGFTKQLNVDGTAADQDLVDEALAPVADALLTQTTVASEEDALVD